MEVFNWLTGMLEETCASKDLLSFFSNLHSTGDKASGMEHAFNVLELGWTFADDIEFALHDGRNAGDAKQEFRQRLDVFSGMLETHWKLYEGPCKETMQGPEALRFAR